MVDIDPVTGTPRNLARLDDFLTPASSDNLVTRGLEPDTRASGEVFEAAYVMADQGPFRSMALDCAVGATADGCKVQIGVDAEGQPVYRTGGYTYGDFPMGGAPEVHASGEVWAQTLWDLRKRFGHDVAGMLITRAMELSADDPTFLDMRNAIVQADLAVYGGTHRTAIWKAFAKRGMGWFAGAIDASDAFPAEDFSMPPHPTTPRSTVSGQVADPVTNLPVANALVAIGGHDSGYTGDYTAVTDGSGRYTIPNVFVGTYPVVTVFAPKSVEVKLPASVTVEGFA